MGQERVAWEVAVNRVAIGGSCFGGATASAQRWREHSTIVDSIADGIADLARRVEAAQAGWSPAASEAFRQRLSEVSRALNESGEGSRRLAEVLDQCSSTCHTKIRSMAVPPEHSTDFEQRRLRFSHQGRVEGFAVGTFEGAGHGASEEAGTVRAYQELGAVYTEALARLPQEAEVRLPVLPAERLLHNSTPWWQQLASTAETVSKGLSALPQSTPSYGGAPYEPYEPNEPAPLEDPGIETSLAGAVGGLGDGTPGTVGPASPMTTSPATAAVAGRLPTAVAGGGAAAGPGGVGMYPPMMPFGGNQDQRSDGRGCLIDDSGTFDPREASTGVLE